MNHELVGKIQPQGGLSFKDEKFIKTGDGYECCIYIHAFPASLDENWLATLTNVNNAVVSVDISSEDMNKIRQHINRSVDEHKARYNDSRKDTDSADSANRVQELRNLYTEIASNGEIIKLITIRIFISGRTLQECDDNVKTTMNYLESFGYKPFVDINEGKQNWISIFQAYKTQQNEKIKRYGQPLTTRAVAGGNPFHFTSLSDPFGSYFGWTDTQGTVLFDMFNRTKTRMSYNAVAIGSMGAGKSTTLKKILEDRAIRGDYIRCFDATGEYKTLVNSLGGKMISLDGSEGILNALEVLKTDESEELSFSRHLSKLTTVYKLLSPTAQSQEIQAFEQLIREFYGVVGLIDDINGGDMHVTGHAPEEYPIWSDFLRFVDRKINEVKTTTDYVQDQIERNKVQRWDNIKLVIYGLVKNYGTLFDGYTSIDNIMHTQIVCYNIASLKNLKPEIFDAQIFLAQSQWWDNCVRLGMEQKDLFESGQIQDHEVIHFLGIIDEAHTMINANKTVTLDQLLVFCREARKFFGGLIFASQSIRDFVPEGADSENVDRIKTLFEMTQYKFIMRQDSNSIETLNRIFAHQLNTSELNDIPQLEKGECILAINGDRNIRFHVYVTPAELQKFSGGA